MAIDGNEIVLDISGLGIVFYSPDYAKHIAEGEDYLTPHYNTAEQVQSHIQNGSIVGFGTGSPGTFVLRFHSGYPDETNVETCEFELRLGLRCNGGVVCFRDLYDLLDWRADSPTWQVIALEVGFYHVTLCSDLPESGIV